MMACSSDLLPCRVSMAKAVAVTGLSTFCEIRRCICPDNATGRSGVILTVAAPTYNSPAHPSDFATDQLNSNIAVAMQRIVIEERKHMVRLRSLVGSSLTIALAFRHAIETNVIRFEFTLQAIAWSLKVIAKRCHNPSQGEKPLVKDAPLTSAATR